MKLLALLFLALSTNALANGQASTVKAVPAAQAQQSQQSQQTSTSEAKVETNGNSQNITLNLPAPPADSTTTVNQNVRQEGDTTSRIIHSGTQTVRNVPSVNGPQLTSSNDTCMGSMSASVNVPGLGIGGGKTVIDKNCVMLKNSRELWNMGMKAAALARMCMDPDNMEALELTSFECPQTTRAKARAEANATAERSEITDPYVRSRMGLPPLK
jgi:hypothetical protein